jgi:uncharacterized membrane protein
MLARRTRLGGIAEVFEIEWLFGASAEGARSLLATIAGSMVSIAATVFSITVVALSLAAGQMGPRLLRTFMRDPGMQASLGMFVATFAFCVVVLGVVNVSNSAVFVPQASVSAALALALASLAVLIYFIHHVARSIQAPVVIGMVGAELEAAIEAQFPAIDAGDDEATPAPQPPAGLASESAPVRSPASGYVQVAQCEALVELAAKADIIVWQLRRAGDHVIAGAEIARIWPASKCTDELCRQVQDSFSFGDVRTPVQDVMYLINQLIEIAQRALSPGINDPATAAACVDRLGVALSLLARRRLPPALHTDGAGTLRVVAPSLKFATIVDAAFDPLRTSARGNLQVSLRLAALIAELAQFVCTAEQRQALLDQAQMIRSGACELPEARDRRLLEACCQRASEALSGPPASAWISSV